MTLWVVKGGSKGERVDRMLANSVLGMGWEEVGDLSKFDGREALKTAYRTTFPADGDGRVNVVVGQLWAFAHSIKMGDTVVVPLTTRGQVAVGSASGPYRFTSDFGTDMQHVLPVKWYRTDVPRSDFDQDLLYSFGAFMTVCTVHRDHAEERVLATVQIKKAPEHGPEVGEEGQPKVEDAPLDLDQIGRDAILAYIRRRTASCPALSVRVVWLCRTRAEGRAAHPRACPDATDERPALPRTMSGLRSPNPSTLRIGGATA